MNTTIATVTKDSALEAVTCLAENLSMLASGDWDANDDSCAASLAMVERLNTFLAAQSFQVTAERDKAIVDVKCIGKDFASLASGDWVPDDESCVASLAMVERLHTLITTTEVILH